MIGLPGSAAAGAEWPARGHLRYRRGVFTPDQHDLFEHDSVARPWVQREVLAELGMRVGRRLEGNDLAAFPGTLGEWQRVSPDVGADVEHEVARLDQRPIGAQRAKLEGAE